MANLIDSGCSIVAYCPGCRQGKSTFEWHHGGNEHGSVKKHIDDTSYGRRPCTLDFRLYRCAGCGSGAWAKIEYGFHEKFPNKYACLVSFYPESKQRLSIPNNVPYGIKTEFREAEKCYENDCNRASVGLIRSVLDKTLRANGYKTEKRENLYQQIEAAADDGIITASRKKKAHDDIRVLGNDILHDEWCEIEDGYVEAARHYAQRILEDFYDDRGSVIELLRENGRIPHEDKEAERKES